MLLEKEHLLALKLIRAATALVTLLHAYRGALWYLSQVLPFGTKGCIFGRGGSSYHSPGPKPRPGYPEQQSSSAAYSYDIDRI